MEKNIEFLKTVLSIPTHTFEEDRMIDFLIDYLSEKKYNRFQWWRRYHNIQELDEKAPMRLKILNGDYEYPNYFYQAQHEVYRMSDEVNSMSYGEDRIDRINLYMERYRRLMEDSHKEEDKRFNGLKKRLSKEFKMTKEAIEDLMQDFDGTIDDLYLYLKYFSN